MTSIDTTPTLLSDSPEVRAARDRVLLRAFERMEAKLLSSNPQEADQTAASIVRATVKGYTRFPAAAMRRTADKES